MYSIDVEQVVAHVDFTFISVVLFGSYARGDFHPRSDIDIMVVAPLERKTFSVGRINYTIYTPNQLTNMAKDGNLFILHIIKEGKVIRGYNIVKDLSEIFNINLSQKKYQDQVKDCFDLLNIDVKTYNRYHVKLHTLLLYLVRSYLYSCSIARGHVSFSRETLLTLVDADLYKSFEQIKLNARPDHKAYIRLFIASCALVKRDDIKVDEPRNLEVSVINSFYSNRLKFILGLRVLNINDVKIEY